MSADAATARKVLEHIRPRQDQHDQGKWITSDRERIPVAASNSDRPPCGTAFCFAGWYAFLAAPKGAVLGFDALVILPDGQKHDISTYAMDGLRLTHVQADELFAAGNSFAELDAMVSALEQNPDAGEPELSWAANHLGLVAWPGSWENVTIND